MSGDWLEYAISGLRVGDELECRYVDSEELYRFTQGRCYKVGDVKGVLGFYDDSGAFRKTSWSKFVVTSKKNSVEVHPQKEYPNFYKAKECFVYYKTIRDHLNYVDSAKKKFLIIGGDNFIAESDEVFEEIMERLSNDPSIKQNMDIE